MREERGEIKYSATSFVAGVSQEKGFARNLTESVMRPPYNCSRVFTVSTGNIHDTAITRPTAPPRSWDFALPTFSESCEKNPGALLSSATSAVATLRTKRVLLKVPADIESGAVGGFISSTQGNERRRARMLESKATVEPLRHRQKRGTLRISAPSLNISFIVTCLCFFVVTRLCS